MKDREYIIKLYTIYKKLLSDKEVEYFENYYYEDYSLSEISINNKVSRAYVSKVVNLVIKKLYKFEDALSINERNDRINSLLDIIKDKDIKSKIADLL